MTLEQLYNEVLLGNNSKALGELKSHAAGGDGRAVKMVEELDDLEVGFNALRTITPDPFVDEKGRRVGFFQRLKVTKDMILGR